MSFKTKPQFCSSEQAPEAEKEHGDSPAINPGVTDERIVISDTENKDEKPEIPPPKEASQNEPSMPTVTGIPLHQHGVPTPNMVNLNAFQAPFVTPIYMMVPTPIKVNSVWNPYPVPMRPVFVSQPAMYYQPTQFVSIACMRQDAPSVSSPSAAVIRELDDDIPKPTNQSSSLTTDS